MTGMRAAVAVVLMAGWLAGCGADEEEPTLTAADLDEALGTSEVVYEVEGEQPDWVPKGLRAMSASITIQTPTGTSQADVSLPLRHKVTGREGLHLDFDRGEFVYVSAQNKGEYGSVTCRITVDGVVVSENTASGSYGVATCKGSS